MMKEVLRGGLLLVLAAGSMLGTGCARVMSIDLPHPMTRGAVAPNRVPNPDENNAARFGLPYGTFTDEASLVSMDAQQACFAVTLRADGDHANLAQLSEWRVFLRGDPNIEIMSPVFGPASQASVMPMQGSVLQQRYAGTYTSCTRYSYGVQCSQHPRYISVRVPAIVNVVTGGGAVCFAHGGVINRNTQQVTLHLDDPSNVGRRLAFRWRLIP